MYIIICNNYNKIRNKYVAYRDDYEIFMLMQRSLDYSQLICYVNHFRIFKTIYRRFEFFGEYIKIALIIICENIMMIHVFSSNNSN